MNSPLQPFDRRLLRRRQGALTLAAALAAFVPMGPFRILDGAHWPSDVLAGYALVLVWTITVLAIGLPWAAGLRHTGDHL
jgi:membrane-associated phospholipid phosphatase